MIRKCSLLICLFISLVNHNYAQQAVKKVTIIVSNAKTGTLVSEAEVILKKVWLGPKIKQTGTDGVATFDVIPTLSYIVVEVKPSFLSGLRSTSINIPVSADKAVYESRISLQADDKIVSVRVKDDAGPVSDAHVVLINARDMKDGIANTDGSGLAVFDVSMIEAQKTMRLQVTKDGYKPYESTVTVIEANSNYEVPVQLTKQQGVQMLEVQVLSDEGNPIKEAGVSASLSLLDGVAGTTNENGIAVLALQATGSYQVTVKQSFFHEPAPQFVEVKKYGSEPYKLYFKMNRKKGSDDKIDLSVTVVEQDLTGATKRIPGATVSMGKLQATTDANGIALFKWAIVPNDEYTISVSANDFETKLMTFTVGDMFRYGGKSYETGITLKRKGSDKQVLVAQVLDHQTNAPVPGAYVSLKSSSGAEVSGTSVSNGAGEASLTLNKKDVASGQFRLVVTANNYEDKWSDVSADQLSNNSGPRLVQVYLKAKKFAKGQQVKYGPFAVNLSGWVSTGLKFKRGGTFSVIVEGKIISTDDKGQPFEMSPNGSGHWGWFALKGKIGDNQQPLGSTAGGYADADGVLELGAPRVWRFFPDDAKGTTGNWLVYIVTSDAVKDGTTTTATTETGNGTNTGTSNLSPDAKNHLAFLKLLLNKDVKNMSPADAANAVRAIVSSNNLENVKKFYNFEVGLTNIKHCLEYDYNRVGSPTETEKKQYDSFLSSIIGELEGKMK